MSHTYNIACHECEVMLWIGQRGTHQMDGWLYCSEDAINLHCEFLYKHIGHRLEFNESEYFDATTDYAEIDSDPKSPTFGEPCTVDT